MKRLIPIFMLLFTPHSYFWLFHQLHLLSHLVYDFILYLTSNTPFIYSECINFLIRNTNASDQRPDFNI